MNSRERIKKAVRHEKTDVIPVGPYMANHCAKVAGYKLMDCYTNADNMAEAQYKAWQLYKQDIIVVQSDNYYVAEGFGCKILLFQDSTPCLKEPIIKELRDIDKLKLLDPGKDGRMPVYLKAMEILRRKVGENICLRGCGTGPFTLASYLMGTERFLMEIAVAEVEEDESTQGQIKKLIDICTEMMVLFAKAMLESGSDIIQCGDSLASMDMISPEIYEKYAFPYERKFFDAVTPFAKEKDAFLLLHICGNNTKVIEKYYNTGADIIEVDYKSDLKVWKERIGSKVTLIGNLDPTGVLLQGNTNDVREASLRCIESAGNGGGFILGSGCEVPIYSPKENIMEMIKTARSYKI